MNNKLLFLVMCLILIGQVCIAQKKNYHVSAVAFYNMENFFDPFDDPNKNDEEFTPSGANHYTEEVYRQKVHNLAKVVKQLGTELNPDGPAIIGVAEIENGAVLEELSNQPELKERNYKYVWFEGPDPRGIDVALLYNPKYFSVIGAMPLSVSLSGTGGKEITRDILHVWGNMLGDTIHVLVNHWPSRRGGEAATAPKRATVAAVNKSIVDSMMNVNPNVKVFIMGDLNDDPVDVSVTNTLGANGDKSRVKHNDLYNPWVSFYKEGIGTLGYNNSWNLFDQIIISGALLDREIPLWSYYKAEVFNKEFLKEKYGEYKGYPHRSFSGGKWINGYSDHFPVLVYLIKPE